MDKRYAYVLPRRDSGKNSVNTAEKVTDPTFSCAETSSVHLKQQILFENFRELETSNPTMVARKILDVLQCPSGKYINQETANQLTV